MDVWLEYFQAHLAKDGLGARRRREQNGQWFHTLLKEAVLGRFFATPAVRESLLELESKVARGECPVLEAVESLLAQSLATD